MRVARLKADGAGHYHCLSRVVDRRMVMGVGEKEKFRKLMRAVEGFCGVEILTYAVMSNHFHILVHVPERKAVGDAELLERMKLLYPKSFVDEFGKLLAQAVADGQENYAEMLRKKYLYRMYDVSQFMKTLKQRFSMEWHLLKLLFGLSGKPIFAAWVGHQRVGFGAAFANARLVAIRT